MNYYKERDRKSFGNARDVITLAKTVISNAQMRERTGSPVLKKEDFTGYVHLFDGFGASTREEAYSELKKYIGMDFLEQMFDDQCNLFDECTDKGMEYPGPEHMIWVGNPGTGKTTLARVIATLNRFPVDLRNCKLCDLVPSETTGEKTITSRSSP